MSTFWSFAPSQNHDFMSLRRTQLLPLSLPLSLSLLFFFSSCLARSLCTRMQPFKYQWILSFYVVTQVLQTNRLYLAVWHFPGVILQAPGCRPPDAQEHMKFAVHVCVLHACVYYLPAECLGVPVRLFPSVWKMVTALPCRPQPRGLDTRGGAQTHTFTHTPHGDTPQVLMHSSTSELPPHPFSLSTSSYLPTYSLHLSFCVHAWVWVFVILLHRVANDLPRLGG